MGFKMKKDERLLVLDHYGRMCRCCGEKFIEFLVIDHINNDGNIQRKKFKVDYRWIIKNKYPKDLQVLCHNCNASKSIYGYCPHNSTLKVES